MKIRSIRGFHDILPESTGKWRRIEDIASSTFELYGYNEIRIPVLEHTELFARSIGGTTDIVEKEMYTFEDRDGSSLTLRPEGTAGVVRSYIEHSIYAKQPLSKLYYSGMMFRHERPQKGRFRGFYQIGAELLGTDEAEADAEMIDMLWALFKRIGLDSSIKIEINSIGDENCRPKYKQLLVDYFRSQISGLCEDCVKRLDTNPLRILDCKKPGCREVAQDAPSMLDSLCNECSSHFGTLKSSLDLLKIPYSINPKIVRGLDYYTKTVFELTTDKLGSQNAVAAGGRYDLLVEEMGGPPTPAVGFAMGIERLVLLHDTVTAGDPVQGIQVFIAHHGPSAKLKALELANKLRTEGVSTDIDYESKSLKSQLKRANKLNADFCFILGEDEITNSTVTVRDMKNSEEEQIGLEEVLENLSRYRSGG